MSGKLEIIAPETMKFFGEIRKIQEEAVKEITIQSVPSEGDIQTHLQKGAPLINFVKKPVNKKVFQNLARRISNQLAVGRPAQKEAAEKVKKFLLNPETDYKKLLDYVIWQEQSSLEDISIKNELSPEIFSFIIVNVAKAFYFKLAESMKPLLKQEQWQKNYCPVCGWGGHLDQLGKENARYLVCSFCETEWRFPRIKCPYCNNEDHKTLGYFTVEGDDLHRVSYCKKCQGYIKTTDTNKLISKSNPVKADMETVHLDMLAMEQGFEKKENITSQKAAEN